MSKLGTFCGAMAGFATIAALDEHSFVYGCLHDVAAAAPAAAPAASGGAVPAKLVEECKKAGEAVAAAKKSGASKEDVAAKVEKLLSLKKQITALDPNHSLAIVDKKKKAKGPAQEEKKGLSKREQKRLARGEDVKKKKKDKDPNRWAVDPAKAAAKAEKARLKALAKAEAEKADVRTPRLRVDGAEVPQRHALITHRSMPSPRRRPRSTRRSSRNRWPGPIRQPTLKVLGRTGGTRAAGTVVMRKKLSRDLPTKSL